MPKQNDLPSTVTYNQKFYAKAAGMDVDLPEAITPEQKYLKAIAERGESIGNIGDVEIDNPENGEVMKYDAEQGKWVNGTASGGGGTSDYTDLTNKPKINNVTLAGNKSLSDIGAAAADETYTDAEVDALLSEKADADDVYTKAQNDAKLAKKVDKETGKGLSTEDYTAAEKAKLAAIEAGAEVNVQANWTQTTTTANDYIKNKPTLGTAAAKNYTSSVSPSSDLVTSEAVNTALAEKADLENGKVPASQLPAYVDDVLERDNTSEFPATGESGKIYIAADTNKTYRWSGSAYVEISESLALGETASTAYAGNKGKANADAIAAIKDGTNIDSFADVETALALKANTADIGTAATADTTTSITSGGTGLPTSGAVYTDQQRQDAEIGSLTAATAVLVDKGAKNLVIDFGQIEHNGCIFTYGSDGRITVSGTKSTALAMAEFISNQNLSNYGLSAGDKIVAVSDNENVGVSIIFAYDQGTQDPAISVYNETRTITIPSGRTKWYLRLEIKSSIRGTINESIKPMVCDKKLYDIDPTVTPYVPTNRELYEMILALQNAQNGG